MNVKKHLWSLVRMALPGVGFALTCIGVYLVSLQTEKKFTLRVISAYILMVVGLLAMLSGVFWALFHSMKSKMYQRGCNRERHIQIYTVERVPSTSFPPSYEESQRSRTSADPAAEFVVVNDGVDMVMSLAPPLYSSDSSEAPDCTWSWEQPPRYSRVEGIQQGQVHAEEQGEAVA
ncbi:transmembrane protein 252 [Anabas testudineus]|uniref:transmembrane protein 252 n=1 Tax=Anabas testudineus TaxID=64144 RepID=UPI000E464E62|nr:transmembrane protein 252 [Anabas testudineus]